MAEKGECSAAHQEWISSPHRPASRLQWMAQRRGRSGKWGGKPVPAEAVHDDHVVCLQVDFLSYAWRHPVALKVHIKDSVRTPPATGGDFTVGARRRSPDNHRTRMTSQAGHVEDPGVEDQLLTWYHSGGGLLTRDWFTGSPFWGEKWSARCRTGTACRLSRRTVVSMTSHRRRRRLAGRNPRC